MIWLKGTHAGEVAIDQELEFLRTLRCLAEARRELRLKRARSAAHHEPDSRPQTDADTGLTVSGASENGLAHFHRPRCGANGWNGRVRVDRPSLLLGQS